MKPRPATLLVWACPAVLLALGAFSRGQAQAVETTFIRLTNTFLNGVGYGVNIIDFDGDGRNDIFLTDRGANGLFRNNGNGTFTRVNDPALGAGGVDGSAWGDFDNDGRLDLLLATSSSAADVVARNQGGSFRQLTSGEFYSGDISNLSAAWGDFDGDGWLDAFASALGGSGKTYFHNNRNGTFSSVDPGAAGNAAGNSGVAPADFDGDGDLDLFIADLNGNGSALYVNNGLGVFSLWTANAFGAGILAASAAWGDYDNDGDLDLVLVGDSNYPSQLYRNDRTNFLLVASAEMAAINNYGLQASWGDYDNDGWLDLFVSSQLTANHVLHNERDGTFRSITNGPAVNEGDAGGGVWGDLDGDGFLDLLVSRSSRIYHNNGNSNAWLIVRCRGTTSNRAAIGAKVRLRATLNGTNFWQLREIAGGSGLGNQGPLEAHFGIGDATNVDELRIEWPSGIVQTFNNVAPRQFLTIQEQTILYFALNGSGSVSYSPVKSNFFIGEPLTLTATPWNPNWTRFLRWSDGNTNNPRTITVGFTNVLTAIFTNFVPLEHWAFRQWDRAFGGTGTDQLWSVHQTADAGYVLGGKSDSLGGGNKTAESFGLGDAWLVRLDAAGLLLWDRTFGGIYRDEARSVYQTGNGGFVLSAESESGADGNKTSTNFGNFTRDYWLVWTDPNGNKIGDQASGGVDQDARGIAQPTRDGGLIQGGFSDSGAGGNKTSANFNTNVLYTTADFWVVRLDAAGHKLWDHSFGGSEDDWLFSLQVTADGGFILGGSSTSDADGNKTAPNYGAKDFWVVRLDANGDKLWDRSFGAGGDDEVTSLRQTADGGFILCGRSDSAADGNKTSPHFGLYDFWVVRLDANGSNLWQRSFGGTGDDGGMMVSIDLTPDGGFILGGDSSSSPSGNKISSSAGGSDFWIVRLDADGNKLWEQSYGGGTNDMLTSLESTADGGFILGGTSSSDATGNKTAVRLGGEDFWVVKLAEIEQPVGTPRVLVNGLHSPSNHLFHSTSPVAVTMTSLWNGPIHFTINGSEPDFDSPLYDPASPVQVIPPATVKTIAYLDDLYLQTGLYVDYSDVVTTRLNYAPQYTLSMSTPGGGTVALTPAGGPFTSNTVVTLAATNLPGWTFLGWQGDVSDTNPVVSVTMRSNVTAQAIFGTVLTTNMTGPGSIGRTPALALYPYGSSVRLTALPGPSRYLSLWGGALSGSISPQELTITNANPSVSATFGTLAGATFGLTVQIVGEGTVSYAPATNRFGSNSVVTLTATPKLGWTFSDWSGGSNSTLNPLALVMHTNKTVTATFPLGPAIAMTNPASGAIFTAPASILLGASASAGDGVVTNVSFFYAGTNFIGRVPNAPFNFPWNNVSAGSYSLTAVATDNRRLSVASVPVNITVNQSPLVSITSPANGASFITGTNVLIEAGVAEVDGGTVTLVEFFAGGALIGSDAAPPFSVVWSNVPAGTFAVTARATDNGGLSATSAPVTVTVSLFPGPPAFRFEQTAYSANEGGGTVALHVIRNFSGFATVNYATGDGSANAGADYNATAGQLQFQSGESVKTVTVGILEDFVVEGNHTFTASLSLPSSGALAEPSVATVTILDNDVQTGSSFLSIVPPAAVNMNDLGSLRVYLTGDAALGQWRLPWERAWRNSGTVAGGLQPGLYEIEFKPVAGYLVPEPVTLAVNAAQESRSTNAYTSLVSPPAGSLTVFIDPPEVAVNADPGCRGQWSVLDHPFMDSGATVPNLPAGSYAVQFKGLAINCGWSTPATREATVRPGVSNSLRVSYVTNASGVSTPAALNFANDIQNSYANQQPFTFVGQVVTEFGEGSGVVVKERVVLTAAHVVFDDYSLSWAGNARWFFQRHSPDYNPAPQEVRGYYVNDGYAAQRQTEGTPGVSSPASFDLDVAALYFYEAAGRGGYGGYLVSETPSPQWLQTNALKALVGYPVEGIAPANLGKMHSIGPTSMSFDQTTGAVFACSQIRGLPGNSGGPLCVRFAGNNYFYPAGIYVGGSDKAIVRAIDSRAVELINQAELTSNLGTNQGSGGVVRFGVAVPAGTCYEFATVTLGPASALPAGAQWRVHYKAAGLSPWTNSSAYRIVLNNKPDFLELAEAEGFLTPDPVNLSLGCQATNLSFDYVQLLPRLDVMDRRHLILSGVTSRTYRVEYNSRIASTSAWTPLTNISFPPNRGTAVISNALPSVTTNRFFRAWRAAP